MGASSERRTARRDSRCEHAIESWQNAASAIGRVTAGLRLFVINRGQWSMVDAILHCLDEIGPSKLSLWSWTAAEHDVQVLTRLRVDKRVLSGLLVIDPSVRNRHRGSLVAWQKTFGEQSIRLVVNHAKISTLESQTGLRVLIRGSMNLNHNPRFEQLDISEGGEEFELVRRIESELPYLPIDCSSADAYEASQVGRAFAGHELEVFGGLKTWRK